MKFIYTILFLGYSVFLFAQQPTVADTSRERSIIIIDNADFTRFIRDQGYFLSGNVRMRQDSVYFRADTAIKKENQFTAWKDVSIQQGDSLSVFSDSLFYSGDSLMAYLEGEVALVDRERKLFTDDLIYDLDRKVAQYNKGGLLTDQEAQLYSNKGRYEVRTDLMYFEDSVRVTHPDFLLKSEILAYNMKRDSVLFRGPTLMTFDSTRIYCEKGYYDIEAQIGHLNENAEYLRGKEEASAGRMEYYGKSDRTYMIGDATFKSPERFASADTILYDGKLRRTALIGNAFFDGENTTAKGNVILFDNETGEVFTKGRSTISLDKKLLTADSTYLSEEQENGFATGGVVWTDTVENLQLITPELRYTKKDERIVTLGGRPVFTMETGDKDTLFLSADTILTFNDTLVYIKDSIPVIDTFRIIKAYYDVRIWSKEISGICDSLVYLEKDSVFHLYYEPVLWADSSQISADTISLHLKEGALDRMHARKNALMIDWVVGDYFNQVESRAMFAFFNESTLKKVSAVGNASSYYYILDEEDAFIGLQESVSSRIEASFDSTSNLEKISFIREVDGKILPISNLDPMSKRFKSFNWRWDRKPNALEDLDFDPRLFQYVRKESEVQEVEMGKPHGK